MLVDEKDTQAVCIFSTRNLRHNVEVLRKLAPKSELMIMVKGDGYGLGTTEVGERLDGLVDYFGVAKIGEAMTLSEYVHKTPIALVYGPQSLNELRLAVKKGFIVTFHRPEHIEWLKVIEAELEQEYPDKKIKAFFGIDTGHGREGFALEHALVAYEALSKNKLIEGSVSIQSHLSNAENPKNPKNREQIEIFDAFVKQIREKHPKKEIKTSLCNSAATVAFPEAQGSVVRIGALCYGFSSFANEGEKKERSAEALGFKPVVSLHAPITNILEPEKAREINYSLITIPKNSRIGVVAAGYFECFPHASAVQETRSVLVREKLCPVIPTANMDAVFIDLGPCGKAADIGDMATLFGHWPTLRSVADSVHTLPHVLMTGIGRSNLKKIWDDKVSGPDEKDVYEANASANSSYAQLQGISDPESQIISIKNIPKTTLFTALFNRAECPQLGLRIYGHHPSTSFPVPMTEDLAGQIIEQHGLRFYPASHFENRGPGCIVYINAEGLEQIGGRHLFFSLEGDYLNAEDYDRVNGKGAAREVVRAIRSGQQSPENEKNEHYLKKYNDGIAYRKKNLFGEFISPVFDDVYNRIVKGFAAVDPYLATMGGIEDDFLNQVCSLLNAGNNGTSRVAGGFGSKLLALYEICGKDPLKTAAVIWHAGELSSAVEVIDAVLAFEKTGKVTIPSDKIDAIVRNVQRRNDRCPMIVPDPDTQKWRDDPVAYTAEEKFGAGSVDIVRRIVDAYVLLDFPETPTDNKVRVLAINSMCPCFEDFGRGALREGVDASIFKLFGNEKKLRNLRGMQLGFLYDICGQESTRAAMILWDHRHLEDSHNMNFDLLGAYLNGGRDVPTREDIDAILRAVQERHPKIYKIVSDDIPVGREILEGKRNFQRAFPSYVGAMFGKAGYYRSVGSAIKFFKGAFSDVSPEIADILKKTATAYAQIGPYRKTMDNLAIDGDGNEVAIDALRGISDFASESAIGHKKFSPEYLKILQQIPEGVDEHEQVRAHTKTFFDLCDRSPLKMAAVIWAYREMEGFGRECKNIQTIFACMNGKKPPDCCLDAIDAIVCSVQKENPDCPKIVPENAQRSAEKSLLCRYSP